MQSGRFTHPCSFSLISQLFCAEGDQRGAGVEAEIFKVAFKLTAFHERRRRKGAGGGGEREKEEKKKVGKWIR